MKQKCFQITTKRVRRSQQFQLRRQLVLCSRCHAATENGSVANSSTCPRHDEVATQWSAQCRSTWNIGNRCQVWGIRSDLWISKHSLYWILWVTGNPAVQLSKSWSHTVTRLYIQNGACRCMQDSLERCQRGSCKAGQHGVAIVQTRQDKCCN